MSDLNPFARPMGAMPQVSQKSRWFLFADWHGRLVPYNDKHTILFGKFMREFLGFIETDDDTIFSKSIEEIRAMNLPRNIAPHDTRRTILKGGEEIPYTTHDDIRKIYGK